MPSTLASPTAATAAVHTVLSTELGELTVVRDGDALTGVYFPHHWTRPDRSAFGPRSEQGFEQVAVQLGAS